MIAVMTKREHSSVWLLLLSKPKYGVCVSFCPLSNVTVLTCQLYQPGRVEFVWLFIRVRSLVLDNSSSGCGMCVNHIRTRSLVCLN